MSQYAKVGAMFEQVATMITTEENNVWVSYWLRIVTTKLQTASTFLSLYKFCPDWGPANRQ
jgi:hypothetical protein